MVAREAGYSFEFARTDDHEFLRLASRDDAQRLTTDNPTLKGGYNTVLADTELPKSGRAYWEVKIVRKAHDGWDYIGVADPKVNLKEALTKNKDAPGYFLGGNDQDTFVYQHMVGKQEWNKAYNDYETEFYDWITDDLKYIDKKNVKTQFDNRIGQKIWTGKGAHVGQMVDWPSLTAGRTIGVDVNMDDGTLAYWADGQFLGVVTTTEGKPLDLKGKKLVPAISIYGRSSGPDKQGTVVEVKTGLEPPTRPDDALEKGMMRQVLATV